MRMVLMMMILLTALCALFTNAGIQTFRWMRLIFKGINPFMFGIGYALLIVLIIGLYFASRIPNIAIPRIILYIDQYAFGFSIFFVMILNVVSALIGIGKFVRFFPVQISDKLFLIIGTICAVLICGITIYGSIHAGTIKTISYDIPIGEKKDTTDSIKIALISDLHLGYVIDENHLQKIADEIQNIQPDVVCIAGDVFDGDITALDNPQKLQEIFRSIESRYGIYACLGNHDAGKGYDEMLDFLEASDIQLLLDEKVVIDNRFVLVGRRDSSPIGEHGEERTKIEEWSDTNNLPVIVMDHQPGNIREYGNEVDLILCGHTHKGQIFPIEFITNALFDVDYGYYRASDESPHVIVTSGAGTWGPPQRILTNSEVVEINVVCYDKQ